MDKLQRNAIFEAITAAELDPRDFELDNNGDDDDAEARISHRGSGSAFTLNRDASGG
jgi:hypothetical protein